MSENYTALIGDIVNSKKIENRGQVQNKLNEVLDKVNKEYKNELASKFMITLGDEFQGLLYSSDKILKIVEFIENEMFPIKIRFGIGVGEIYTKINYEPLGADGPAYYNARDMINELKTKGSENNYICVKTGNSEKDKLMNISFSLLGIIKSKWTLKQRKATFMGYYYKLKQTEIAEKMDTTQSAINQIFKAAHYNAYCSCLDTIGEMLRQREEGK